MRHSLDPASLPGISPDRLWTDLMRLAEVTEPGLPGWTRRVFSPAYLRARALVRGWMEGAGLQAHQDQAGNLIGRLGGSDPNASALVVGSHSDTVWGGGRFDGMVGVVAGLEVARVLRGSESELRHPLWVVDFLGEEPNRFGLSCLGSRAVGGHLEPSHLLLGDGGGGTLGDALEGQGVDPARLSQARWSRGQLHAYIELHVEQGGRLERAGRPLGVVTAIAGIHRARIQIRGRADHSGTTPMELRHDALLAAAQVIQGVDEIARRSTESEGVATVGTIAVEPNAANVVPGQAILTAEFRSTDESWLRAAGRLLELLVGKVATDRGVDVLVSWISAEAPTACDPTMRALLTAAVLELGCHPLDVPSGASHDAAHVAGLAPMGMLFVPSRDGRSHCPEEWTSKEQVAQGAEALLRAVLLVDDASL